MLFKKKTDAVDITVRIDVTNAGTKKEPDQKEFVPPAPDMSTKPADIVGYCFGYVCPSHHVNNTFESITVDGFNERRVCQKCGEVGRPATVKRTAEAEWSRHASFDGKKSTIGYQWENHNGGGFFSTKWEVRWNKFEFIKFLSLKSTGKAPEPPADRNGI